MIRVDREAPEAALTAFVRTWLNNIAGGDVAAACAHLDGPNTHGETWTPEAIAHVLRDTFPEGTRFRSEYPEGPVVTAVDQARPQCECTVIAFDDGSGYWVDHDVPLNGAASDLTAQFVFIRRGDGVFAVILHDLHVL